MSVPGNHWHAYYGVCLVEKERRDPVEDGIIPQYRYLSASQMFLLTKSHMVSLAMGIEKN